jgi:outer membrane protein OmpA-like peptidoglycan-associated protein
MTRAIGRWRAAATLLVTLGVVSCNQGPVMRGKIAGLEKLTDQAERNGAVLCAPRELAMAKSHLEFAEVELDQGFVSKAGAHVDIAEPNARAAYERSPPEKCAERDLRDRDGDGHVDRLDRCPEDPENWNGFQDADGCPDDADTDGDGVPDSRDMCVLAPEDKDGYLDEDGCPDSDNDLDTIADSSDKCPNEPEDPDGYEDEDGCPDLDNDKDTVADLDDQCPNEPGPKGAERPGCPGKSLVVVTDKEIRIAQQIHFETGKDVIRRESYAVIDAVAQVLEKNPAMRIEVQGHTDNRGPAGYNLGLSDRRAAAVRRYLVARGVAAERLVSRGYGLTRPLVANDSEQNRSLNRRVQFIRTEGEKGKTTP